MKLLRDCYFRIRHFGRGVPRSIGCHHFRVDESLRRWNFTAEEEVRVCLEQNLSPGDTAVDIGANFGLHTLIMANCVGSSGTVVAFEPIPTHLDLLKRNIKLNSIEAKIEIRETAISDLAADSIEMVFDPTGLDPAASLQSGDLQGSKTSVRNSSLDHEFKLVDISGGCLLKIDVEGAEMSVLRSGIEFLKRTGPKLLIEVHDYALPEFGESTESLYEFLRSLGYSIEQLNAGVSKNGDFHHIFATRQS